MAKVKSFGERIADALVEDGLLTAKQIEELLEQQKKEGARLIKLILDKAYVSEQDLAPVEEYICRRIEAIEGEIYVRARELCRGNTEADAILPALILNTLQLRFVIAIERVGNLLVREQIEVHIARNSGGHPASVGGLHGCYLAELPPMVESYGRISRCA